MDRIEQARQWILQTEWLKRINNLSSEPWIILDQSVDTELEWYGFYCALLPSAIIEQASSNSSWDLRKVPSNPGFSLSWDGKIEVAEYEHFTNPGCIQPLVIRRVFHGIRPDTKEILEEYRLYHNLYFEYTENKYLKFDDDGDQEESIIIEEDGTVRARLKHIRQFLAAKNMCLAIYFDIFRYTHESLEELGLAPDQNEHNEDNLRYTFRVLEDPDAAHTSRNSQSISNLIGKKLIPGFPREQCGVWPFQQDETNHAEFVIDVDEQGDPVCHTCDHEVLSNYFGANPGAPHYLTPVFFKREVLAKYYQNPEKYSVSDGYLYCGNLWGLRIDNNHKKYIITHLGDLGRDLSYREQLYWKSFNVLPEGTFSDVTWRRGFLAEFANPEKADLKFKYEFERFQEKWQSRFGWRLFRPLAEKDSHFYNSLRVPLVDDHAEFDIQILSS